MNTNLKFWMIAFICVLLSLVPRIHKLNTSRYILSGPHSQIIQMIEVWEAEGIVYHKFAGIHTYTDEADKNIHYYPRLVSPKGDNYYISYPPFSFILAYFFIKLFHLPINSGSLWLLNILLLWIASFYTLKILSKYYTKNTLLQVSPLLVMLFLPSSLRLHSEVYFAESLAASLLPIWFWYFTAYLEKRKSFFILIFLSFIIAYTDWLGVILAVLSSIYLLFKNKKLELVSVSIFSMAILAMGLYFFQYSLLVGWDEIYDAFIERYNSRSGLREQEVVAGDTVFKKGFGTILFEKLKNAFFITPILFLFFFLVIIFRKTESLQNSSDFPLGLLIIVIAVNQLVFLNFSLLHQYTFARWELVVAILWVVVAKKLTISKNGNWVVVSMTVVNVVANSTFYNLLVGKDIAPKELIKLADCIRPMMKSGYSNFYTIEDGALMDPGGQLMFYLQRSFMQVDNPQIAYDYLSNYQRDKFVFFNISKNFEQVNVQIYHGKELFNQIELKCE